MLKPGGGAQKQHPCRSRSHNLEAVRNFAWPEDIRARSGLDPFAIADDCQFAFEDVERFIFPMVDVVGRSKARWQRPTLHQSEGSIRVLARGSHCRRENEAFYVLEGE